MSDKYCGGMAFPLAAALPDGLYTVDPGMSLRDYFAAKAMTSLICAGADKISSEDGVVGMAAAAFIIADAMLRERAK